MSGLAVLNDAARELEANLPDAGLGLTLADELREARAAVAELVSASKAYYLANDFSIGISEARERLRAALSKFQEGA